MPYIFTPMRVLLPLALLGLAACAKQAPPAPQPKTNAPPIIVPASIARGADISWLTEMEDSGRTWRNRQGVQQDLFAILRSQGINAIRLRIWVQPANRYNALADVLAKARRAQAAGMRLMLDFHYADNWADPGQQYKPRLWAGLAGQALAGALYTYTRQTLDTLRQAGITPAWVQVGNEVRAGMVWPNGRLPDSLATFAALVDTGYAAVKDVFPQAQVILHLDNGYDNPLYRYVLDGLARYRTRYDVVGMSLYADASNWQAYSQLCLSNARDVANRYGKPTCLVEVGMPQDQGPNCKQYLRSLLEGMATLRISQTQGVFYWEPQAYQWRGYRLGAWKDDGRPTEALEAFAP